MKKVTKTNSFYALGLLLFLVAFAPSGAGNPSVMNDQKRKDSIRYYRGATLINWQLIQHRLHS